MASYYGNTAESLDLNEDLGQDLSQYDAQDDFAPIPPGEYQVQCVEVTLAHSNAGNRMVKAQFQVLGGEYDNRRIFENFNIEHGNGKVVEIAMRSIKSWVVACGLTGNERLTMGLLKSLEGIEFLAAVKIEQDKTGQYGPQNRIRAYKPLPGAAQVVPQQARQAANETAAPKSQPTAAAAQRPAQAASAGKKRPWEK